jgi:hypothetical protein
MLKITDTNYDLYKKVFIRICEFTLRDFPSRLNAEWSPINVLEQWEKKDKAIAKKGLRIGLADQLGGMINDMPEDDKALLNKKLLEEGLPGLWELISIVKNVPAKVLKRGKINNLDEWYVITEVLSDVDSPLTEEQRIKLGELSGEFEDRQRRMGR